MIERQIPPCILVTYYNTTVYMFSRGYISREEFSEVGHKILRELGWNESHILIKIERDALREGGS